MQTETDTDYEKQAQDFLKKVGMDMFAKFLFTGKHFDDDKEFRDVYEIAFISKLRAGKDTQEWRFEFGQSLAHSRAGRDGHYFQGVRAPRAYDVLACLQKYDPGTFAEFCGDFGYDEDSRRAEKIYFAIQKEWVNVRRMFGNHLEALQEIS